jgi:hypothetical protein
MEYQGPTTGDLANVHALNRCFLRAVSMSGKHPFAAIFARRMTQSEIGRLASAPFLLFSLREQDDAYWQQLLSDDAQLELIDNDAPPDERMLQLQVATVGFLWQLARRNPYAARLVCGASVSFCERLAQLTLIDLLQRVARRGTLLRMRFPDRGDIWRRLLGTGTSGSYQARIAAQHGALQAMLTHPAAQQIATVPAAACVRRTPVRQTTERRTERTREP